MSELLLDPPLDSLFEDSEELSSPLPESDDDSESLLSDELPPLSDEDVSSESEVSVLPLLSLSGSSVSSSASSCPL